MWDGDDDDADDDDDDEVQTPSPPARGGIDSTRQCEAYMQLKRTIWQHACSTIINSCPKPAIYRVMIVIKLASALVCQILRIIYANVLRGINASEPGL